MINPNSLLSYLLGSSVGVKQKALEIDQSEDKEEEKGKKRKRHQSKSKSKKKGEKSSSKSSSKKAKKTEETAEKCEDNEPAKQGQTFCLKFQTHTLSVSIICIFRCLADVLCCRDVLTLLGKFY